MPFGRFFGNKPKESAPPPDADLESETIDEGETPESTPAEHDEADWLTRARAVLPTGASTGTKRVGPIDGSPDSTGPTHYRQAVGCRVFDVDGNQYIDCTMALGSVALGYAEPNVTRAVVDAVAAGNVSGLSHIREVDLAERLCGVIPCAD